ncbi:hypothetical protein C8R43DRAFT_1235740 [Mycena crocata]|nr:hypothetical protein C8R43DRAFT_1235740 [Mycena crocata]
MPSAKGSASIQLPRCRRLSLPPPANFRLHSPRVLRPAQCRMNARCVLNSTGSTRRSVCAASSASDKRPAQRKPTPATRTRVQLPRELLRRSPESPQLHPRSAAVACPCRNAAFVALCPVSLRSRRAHHRDVETGAARRVEFQLRVEQPVASSQIGGDSTSLGFTTPPAESPWNRRSTPTLRVRRAHRLGAYASPDLPDAQRGRRSRPRVESADTRSATTESNGHQHRVERAEIPNAMCVRARPTAEGG